MTRPNDMGVPASPSGSTLQPQAASASIPNATPAEAPADERAAFDAAFLSANGFHTKAELATEWEKGLSGVMFRAGLAAHTKLKGTEPLNASELLQLFGGRTIVSITEAVQLTERAHGIGNHTIGGPNFKSPRDDHQNATQPCICNPRTFCHSRDACQAADAVAPSPAPTSEAKE